MRRLSLALAVSAALVMAGPALASGGGGMDSGAMSGGADMAAGGPSADDLVKAYNEGVVAIDAQNWKLAVSKFSFVTDNNPNVPDAWNYLGYSSRKSGNAKKSEVAYKRALKLDPNHPRANEYYGELLLELNRVPEAEQRLLVLQTCCAADPVTAELSGLIAQVKAGKPMPGAKTSAGY